MDEGRGLAAWVGEGLGEGQYPDRFRIRLLSPQEALRRLSKKLLSPYPLRLPTSLKAAVAEISKAEGTSINQFVTTAVAEKVSAMKTAEFFTERTSQADIVATRRLLRLDGGQPPEPETVFDEA